MALRKPCVVFLYGCSLLLTASSETLTILHFNNVNSQLNPYREASLHRKPFPEDCVGDVMSCIGGILNLNAKTNKTNTFVLSPGNLVGGQNGWLPVLGWANFASILKFYNIKAMSLGMNEFSAGLTRTKEYLMAAPEENKKVLMSNVNCPPGETFCQDHVIPIHPLLANKVAVIGFSNPLTQKLSSPGNLEFFPVVERLRDVINGNPMYKTYIAIGEGTEAIAKEILDNVPQVKLVIFTQSFGKPPGTYPMPYKHGYISTAGDFGSTIGQLTIEVDANGEYVGLQGSMEKVTHATDVNAELQNSLIPLIDAIDAEANKSLGKTHQALEGGRLCWQGECNLGNLVTDAMVHCAFNNNKLQPVVLGRPLVAWFQGSSLLNDKVPSGGTVSKMDVHRWLPFHNRIFLLQMSGKSMKEIITRGSQALVASNNADVPSWGQFLQVSNGLEVFVKTAENGQSVALERLRIFNSTSEVPQLVDVVDEEQYLVLAPSFMVEGRGVWTDLLSHFTPFPNPDVANFAFDDDCVEGYVQALGVLSVGLEERIWVDSDMCSSGGTPPKTIVEYKEGNTAVTVLLTIVFMLLIQGIVYVGYFYVLPKLQGRVTSTPEPYSNFN